MSGHLTPVPCPRCGKLWDPAVDGLVELFNHPEVHRWIDNDFKGTTNWCVREHWPKEGLEDQMILWAQAEAIEIAQRMRSRELVLS